MLPRAGCDLQQTFFLNTFQKGSKVSGFQFRYRQITDRREDVIVHTGKQAGSMVLRPGSVALMLAQRHSLKTLCR